MSAAPPGHGPALPRGPAAVCLYHRPGGPAGHGSVLPEGQAGVLLPRGLRRRGPHLADPESLRGLALLLFGIFPLLYRQLLRGRLRLHHHGLLHLNGRRGPAPRHPVLAVLRLLDRGHGRAALHAGLSAPRGRPDPGAGPRGGPRPHLLQAGAQDRPVLPDFICNVLRPHRGGDPGLSSCGPAPVRRRGHHLRLRLHRRLLRHEPEHRGV